MRKILIFSLISFFSISMFAQRNAVSVGESSIDITAGPSTLFLGDIGDPFLESYLFTRNRFDQLMSANSVISVGFINHWLSVGHIKWLFIQVYTTGLMTIMPFAQVFLNLQDVLNTTFLQLIILR